MAGYHIREIARGEIGDVSKIREEVEELEDAIEQGIRVMQLCELSDIIQAVRLNLRKHHPGYTLDDLIQMADVTERAFADGTRVDKNSLKR
jgi:hypothetical protein